MPNKRAEPGWGARNLEQTYILIGLLINKFCYYPTTIENRFFEGLYTYLYFKQIHVYTCISLLKTIPTTRLKSNMYVFDLKHIHVSRGVGYGK